MFYNIFVTCLQMIDDLEMTTDQVPFDFELVVIPPETHGMQRDNQKKLTKSMHSNLGLKRSQCPVHPL